MSDDTAIDHLDDSLHRSRFQLGSYIDEGYNLWKKKPLSFVAILLLAGLISLSLNIIPILGPLLGGLFISPCLTLGIYLSCHIIEDDDKTFKFEDFFSGFSFVSKVIVLNLIIYGFAILLLLPIVMSIGLSALTSFVITDPSTFPVNAISGFTFLLIIPLIYASLLVSYAVPMIGFYKLEPWDALRYSAKYIHKHWIMFFLFMIVIFFIIMLGILAIVIGVIITASMIYPMIYVSFRDVTDLDTFMNPEEDDDLSLGYTGATIDDFR